MSEPPLISHLPNEPTPDALIDAFIAFTTELGIELYPAQEEAILEVLAGSNVILNTPTGSGKSMVAAAAHFAAVARGERSVYTAPIKALVSEKFFELCRTLGSERVGMVTGDAAVNPDAPVICCTAEILSNWALRFGTDAPVQQVIMDEFHYYADPQRGVAWQVPLLELGDASFLLMSATLGPTRFFEEDLEARTGRPTVVVKSADRPVPLSFEYRHTPLHESIAELLDLGRAPVYVVHFTQREAAEQAQNFMSINVLTKEEKAEVKALIGRFRFDTPIGKDLQRFLHHGIGVHHAGLLPKYRLLVEKLAQAGLLKLICGTDTLGVGVNVPIRSVLFTQLCKYDGTATRILTNREFQQIAGRAGRKGFDDRGDVWVQAPPHWIENRRAEEKAAADPKKKKKLNKKKPPDRGYAHWDEERFTKLVDGDPEPLHSSFAVSHQMLLNVLDRPGDGCGALRSLLLDNHEPRRSQRRHVRRAIGMYRSLRDADIVEELDEPDDLGRRVRVTLDLQDEFALNQPLSLFAVEAIDALADDEDGADDDAHALDVVSVIESVLENPGVVLAAQLNKAKTELITELKSQGVEYDERMERLNDVEYPKPLAPFLYAAFDVFRNQHPWVGEHNVAPKSIIRELHERSLTFAEYVNEYGLKRSEGALLRYLSDGYKALVQTVPEDQRTEAVVDVIAWLAEFVRQVDSSLIDEWERLQNPDEEIAPVRSGDDDRPDVTRNTRAFRVMVRNELFRWVALASRRDHAALAELLPPGTWDRELLDELFAPYWDEHDAIVIDSDARGPHYFDFEGTRAVQVVVDPASWNEWRIVASVDLDASREAGRAVVQLENFEKQ